MNSLEEWAAGPPKSFKLSSPLAEGLDGLTQHLEPKHWPELQVLARSHTWLLQA